MRRFIEGAFVNVRPVLKYDLNGLGENIYVVVVIWRVPGVSLNK